MNSRLLSLFAVLCSLWLVSPASLAEPFVFTFDMPAFDQFGNIGVTSVLEVTVDNGGSSSLSQTWDSDQIIALSTDFTGPASSVSLQNGVQSGAITTDAAGVPTLAFGPSNFYVRGFDAGGDRLILVGLDCDYGVYTGDSIVGAVGCAALDGGSIWPITGSGPPVVSPLPSTPVPTLSQWSLMLLALLLGMVGIARVRRQA